MWELRDRWWREMGGGMGELSAGVQVPLCCWGQRRGSGREGGNTARPVCVWQGLAPGLSSPPSPNPPHPQYKHIHPVCCWCGAAVMWCQSTQCVCLRQWLTLWILPSSQKGRHKWGVWATHGGFRSPSALSCRGASTKLRMWASCHQHRGGLKEMSKRSKKTPQKTPSSTDRIWHKTDPLFEFLRRSEVTVAISVKILYAVTLLLKG